MTSKPGQGGRYSIRFSSSSLQSRRAGGMVIMNRPHYGGQVTTARWRTPTGARTSQRCMQASRSRNRTTVTRVMAMKGRVGALIPSLRMLHDREVVEGYEPASLSVRSHDVMLFPLLHSLCFNHVWYMCPGAYASSSQPYTQQGLLLKPHIPRANSNTLERPAPSPPRARAP
jgi:hypothetical protein